MIRRNEAAADAATSEFRLPPPPLMLNPSILMAGNQVVKAETEENQTTTRSKHNSAFRIAPKAK